jgi:hypothetical protein
MDIHQTVAAGQQRRQNHHGDAGRDGQLPFGGLVPFDGPVLSKIPLPSRSRCNFGHEDTQTHEREPQTAPSNVRTVVNAKTHRSGGTVSRWANRSAPTMSPPSMRKL